MIIISEMQQLTSIVTNAPIATVPTKQKTDLSSDVFGSSPKTEMADRWAVSVPGSGTGGAESP